MHERECLLYQATVAEQAKRHDDMVEPITKIASIYVELTKEERDLFLKAYKNVFAARRESLIVLHYKEQLEKNKGAEDKAEMVKIFRVEIELELCKICKKILKVLEKDLIPHATTPENKVFYYKMKADTFRYLAEIYTGSDRKAAVKNALLGYKTAEVIAAKDLPPTNETRLSLALNYSVFCYSILGSPDRARNVASRAYKDARAEQKNIGDDSSKDPNSVLKYLKQNMKIFKVQMPDDGNGDGEQIQNAVDQGEKDEIEGDHNEEELSEDDQSEEDSDEDLDEELDLDEDSDEDSDEVEDSDENLNEDEDWEAEHWEVMDIVGDQNVP